MSKANDVKAPISAELLYEQSMSLINEAITSCGIEGFEGAPLNIPQVINWGELKGSHIPKISDESFFMQANSLFGEQENLFNEPESSQEEPVSTKGSRLGEDADLSSINDMFNAT
ncbi:hypothetical protein [Shewanella surugensis]|uniref:Uncharacterized protein n=1 Tax=Shewanella surugensis TaxID=212020 RepID=A0ABT0LEG0_9GAMM|nr:hypothetical protein [Shewanella surugensis]MCL1126093.1 hypothetical protein [Shewanella surugensis]